MTDSEQANLNAGDGVVKDQAKRSTKRPSIFESERPGWEFVARLPGKKMAIWAGFLWLIFLLRDFFDLLIFTFVLSYMTSHVVSILEARTGKRKLSVIGVYGLLLTVLVLMVALSLPRLVQEGRGLLRQAVFRSRAEFVSTALANAHGDHAEALASLAACEVVFETGDNTGDHAVIETVDAQGRVLLLDSLPEPVKLGDVFRVVREPPSEASYTVSEAVAAFDPVERLEGGLQNFLGAERLVELKEFYRESGAQREVTESMSGAVEMVGKGLTRVLNGLVNAVFHFAAAILFSFLIVLDIPRLQRGVEALGRTRFAEVYEEVAPSLATFGGLLGRAFEAQTMIALVNTLLTLIGMTILGIEGKVFLSLIVFVCSFVPVLGVFISTAPIALIALKNGGLVLVLGAVIMVVVVHVVEAYVLNPQIYGKHMRLHPLLVLVILLTAEHLFGLWGLVLGVPVAAYIYEHVIWEGKRPDRGKPAARALAEAALS